MLALSDVTYAYPTETHPAVAGSGQLVRWLTQVAPNAAAEVATELKRGPAPPLEQLRTIHAGGRVVAPELAVLTWDSSVTLTDRERDVLRLVERGLPNDEIASTLHLAQGTVRNYLSDAMGKLGARTRTEAANAARDRGSLTAGNRVRFDPWLQSACGAPPRSPSALPSSCRSGEEMW